MDRSMHGRLLVNLLADPPLAETSSTLAPSTPPPPLRRLTSTHTLALDGMPASSSTQMIPHLPNSSWFSPGSTGIFHTFQTGHDSSGGRERKML